MASNHDDDSFDLDKIDQVDNLQDFVDVENQIEAQESKKLMNEIEKEEEEFKQQSALKQEKDNSP